MAQTIFVCYLYASWDFQAPGDLGTTEPEAQAVPQVFVMLLCPCLGEPTLLYARQTIRPSHKTLPSPFSTKI